MQPLTVYNLRKRSINVFKQALIYATIGRSSTLNTIKETEKRTSVLTRKWGEDPRAYLKTGIRMGHTKQSTNLQLQNLREGISETASEDTW